MGLREWWNRVNGGSSDPDKGGLADESEDRFDEYQSVKADEFVDQRDPGVMGMVDDEFRRDRQ